MTDFLRMPAEHCGELLGVAAAGVVLVDRRGGVRMAASSEDAELLEVFAAETDCGPPVECR
jgi:hypothetical protein